MTQRSGTIEFDGITVAAVIPVGPGRLENLEEVVASLEVQSAVISQLVIVEDGPDVRTPDYNARVISAPKHEPGMEQPRNLGARAAQEMGCSHVWFVDSDVVMVDNALEELLQALEDGPKDRIVVGPYDWLPEGWRPAHTGEIPSDWHGFRNDPRWDMFVHSEPWKVYHSDLSAGLACFSGNLLWPLDQFERVGGFWPEIHHGRCEDGELGLRAVAMDVGISFAAQARGFHLHHPVNHALAIERNRRDVPMLNERHPWVERGGVFMVDRDGKAFDVMCRGCNLAIPTGEWWRHATGCLGMPGYELPA